MYHSAQNLGFNTIQDVLSSSSEGPTTAKTPHPSSLAVSDLLDLEREKRQASHYFFKTIDVIFSVIIGV